MSSQSVKKFEEAYDSGLIQAISWITEIRFEDYHKQCAWAAWQASRASTVIELPMKFNGEHGGDAYSAGIYDGALDECAEAIRESGISATFQQPKR